MSAPEGSPPHQPTQPPTQRPTQAPLRPAAIAAGSPSGVRPRVQSARPHGGGVGLPPGVRAGDLGPRVIAGLVDALPWIVLSLLQAIVSQVAEVPAWLTVTIVILDVAWLAFLGWQSTSFAATPGLRMMRLQLVAMSDGRPLTWGAWLLRALLLAVLGATVVGWIVMAVLMRLQPRRQSLPDLAVASVVIRQRAVAPRRPGAVARPTSTSVPGPAQYPQPPRPLAERPAVPPYTSPVASAPATNGAIGPNGSAPAVAPADSPVPDAEPAEEPTAPLGSFFGTDRQGPQYGPRSRGPQRETARPMSYPTAADPRPYPGYGLPLAFEPVPGLPGLPTSAPTASDPVAPGTTKQWQLTLDGEQVIEPSALTLFGRNPQVGEGEADVAVVKVRDEARTVSKTHVAVGLDDDGLFAVDRGSTNGSAVTNLDGDYKLLKAGERVPLTEGSTVAFGEHRLVVTLVDRPPLAD